MATQLNIKDAQTVRLVREYAAETGRTVTATIKAAIENDRRVRLGIVDAKITRLRNVLAAVRRDMPDNIRGMTTEEIGNSIYDDSEPDGFAR